MHDMLFANQHQWAQLPDPSSQFAAFAQQLGINLDTFNTCLKSQKHRQAILKAREAGDKLQLTGTPSFVVNGKLVGTAGAQTIDDIVKLVEADIDSALAAK